MENPEEILHSLEEFSKFRPKDIPRELEEYLCYVAKTGDPVYQWATIKSLFREKLINVITEFYEACPSVEIPPCPNVELFNYDTMKGFILEKLDTFAAAPFTIQRICELLTTPRKEYNRIDKYMRALEKNILVVSTTEPGRKSAENGDGIVNGLELEHLPETSNSSDINVEEMDDTPSWQTRTDSISFQTNEVILPTTEDNTSSDNIITTESKLPIESESEVACSSSQDSVITSVEEVLLPTDSINESNESCASQQETLSEEQVQIVTNIEEPVVSTGTTLEVADSLSFSSSTILQEAEQEAKTVCDDTTSLEDPKSADSTTALQSEDVVQAVHPKSPPPEVPSNTETMEECPITESPISEDIVTESPEASSIEENLDNPLENEASTSTEDTEAETVIKESMVLEKSNEDIEISADTTEDLKVSETQEETAEIDTASKEIEPVVTEEKDEEITSSDKVQISESHHSEDTTSGDEAEPAKAVVEEPLPVVQSIAPTEPAEEPVVSGSTEEIIEQKEDILEEVAEAEMTSEDNTNKEAETAEKTTEEEPMEVDTAAETETEVSTPESTSETS